MEFCIFVQRETFRLPSFPVCFSRDRSIPLLLSADLLRDQIVPSRQTSLLCLCGRLCRCMSTRFPHRIGDLMICCTGLSHCLECHVTGQFWLVLRLALMIFVKLHTSQFGSLAECADTSRFVVGLLASIFLNLSAITAGRSTTSPFGSFIDGFVTSTISELGASPDGFPQQVLPDQQLHATDRPVRCLPPRVHVCLTDPRRLSHLSIIMAVLRIAVHGRNPCLRTTQSATTQLVWFPETFQ